MPKRNRIDAGAKLKSVLSPDIVNGLGLECGQSQRLRLVTPFRLVVALLSTLANGRIQAIADILRTFNHQNEMTVAYKAFYNRLCHAGFVRFLRQLCTEMMVAFTMRMLTPKPGSPLERFTDIVIQDGTAFKVKHGLPAGFAGGISKQNPVVRLHTTLSGIYDAVQRTVLTGNKISEQRVKMDPRALCGKLFLGDRAYASLKYFRALERNRASFCIRLSRSYNPFIIAMFHQGKLVELPRPRRLKEVVAQNPNAICDLVASWKGRHAPTIFRVVVFPSKEKGNTRVCTNLDAAQFSPQLVGKLYRLRWQIELLFKEFKSFTNLHRFDSKNPYIVEGLIWASLAAALVTRFCAHAAQAHAGHVPISTMRTASSASFWLRPVLEALDATDRVFRKALRKALLFLAQCAQRASPERDAISGRFAAGFTVGDA